MAAHCRPLRCFRGRHSPDVPATSAGQHHRPSRVTDTEVTVGILHSVTGTMAIFGNPVRWRAEKSSRSSRSMLRAACWARKDQVQSRKTAAKRLADLRREGKESFLVNDKCAGRHGACWTSALAQGGCCRVFEQYNGIMLYYPTFYRRPRAIPKNVIYHRPGSGRSRIIAGLDWGQQDQEREKTF